ncbi:hypothetical protein [Bradyrhizobium sp. SZCCHNRI3052]|uniref:hypothetical protein n=1 Tax=Bradyrhizobium sp. SZCCHNRI3052 TaxID=3057295 RepID=UPI002915C73E|nr:hypothetical protein [Bradyrhizobium sp. SZCCHNRI3052]
MSHDTVEAAARFVFESKLHARDFTVVWHADEPLVVPPAWYVEAFARVAALAPPEIAVQYAFQTNGMLINEALCDLFLSQGARVGVSIDGPPFLDDTRRRTRAGSGTRASALKGGLCERGASPRILSVS